MATGEDQLRNWMIEGLAGNAASHAALLRAIAPLFRAYYRRRMGQDDAVEDLVQETLIAIHTRRASYDPARPVTPWLFAIARYKMIDRFRRQRRECPLEDPELLPDAANLESEIGARLDIESLLSTLPERQAGLVRAMHLEGRSVAEVAQRAGIGESAAKVSVHRALKKLALRLSHSVR